MKRAEFDATLVGIEANDGAVVVTFALDIPTAQRLGVPFGKPVRMTWAERAADAIGITDEVPVPAPRPFAVGDRVVTTGAQDSRDCVPAPPGVDAEIVGVGLDGRFELYAIGRSNPWGSSARFEPVELRHADPAPADDEPEPDVQTVSLGKLRADLAQKTALAKEYEEDDARLRADLTAARADLAAITKERDEAKAVNDAAQRNIDVLIAQRDASRARAEKAERERDRVRRFEHARAARLLERVSKHPGARALSGGLEDDVLAFVNGDDHCPEVATKAAPMRECPECDAVDKWCQRCNGTGKVPQ